MFPFTLTLIFARLDPKQVDEVIDLMKCNVERVLERDEGAAALLTFSDRRSLNFQSFQLKLKFCRLGLNITCNFICS